MSDTRVYFVLARRTNLVKIGVSDDPRSRLSALQTGSPIKLEIVAEMPGDERYERVLHESFAEYRIHGEWFRFVGRLESFVAALPKLPSNQRTPSPRRSEPKKQPRSTINREAVHAHWLEQLALIKLGVYSIGVERFARIVDTTSHHMEHALHERHGKRFAGEWLCELIPLLDRDLAHAIVDKGMEVTGYRLTEDWKIVEDPERREQARVRFAPVEAA